MSVRLFHRRADRFAALVDDAHPADAGLEELLATVDALRSLADSPVVPEPRPAFTADLRERLLQEAATALVPAEQKLLLAPSHRPRRRTPRLAAAGVALVLAGGTAGVAVAAEESLPGQALYPLKQGLEATGRALQVNSADRGRIELSQARTRLSEVDALLARGSTEPVPGTMESFGKSADDGAGRLFTAYQHDGDTADVTAVRTFTAEAMRDLGAVASSAEPSDQGWLSEAATLLTSLDQQAQVLCATCGPSGDLQPPASVVALTAVPAQYAHKNFQITKIDTKFAIKSSKGFDNAPK